MLGFELEEKKIYLDDTKTRADLARFLNSQNIELDKNIEYTMGVFENDELVATGSFYKNTLRCIAVKPEYQGTSILNKVVSHLINEQYKIGNTHIFIYTKPEAAKSFTYLGFHEITRVEGVVLMENQSKGINNYLESLSNKKVQANKVASIVINANPFTKGHQYLVEYASMENDVVHVFVVSEEASIIPFSIRYELIKKGTSHLKNIIIHKGGDYIISSATFPSYFIKDVKQSVQAHAELDLKIFRDYVAPKLNINKRYVGEEPYCEVTKNYNEVMRRVLKEKEIECIIIPRKSVDGKIISASLVRAFLKNGELEKIKDLVPRTTYEFFQSYKGKELMGKIHNHIGRH